MLNKNLNIDWLKLENNLFRYDLDMLEKTLKDHNEIFDDYSSDFVLLIKQIIRDKKLELLITK